jgi:hypothetical protein
MTTDKHICYMIDDDKEKREKGKQIDGITDL